MLAVRIGETVVFNAAVYLTLGLPLAVLPTAVHAVLGYGPVLAGLAVSLQYVGTLLSRPSTGPVVDGRGPKHAVVGGLAAAVAAGLLLVLAALLARAPLAALLLIGVSRLLAGFAESWVGTGAIMWTISRVGPRRTAQVISWNGITSYGGLAIGAPLGVVIAGAHGLAAIGFAIAAVAALALLGASRRPGRPGTPGRRLAFSHVFARVTPLGLALGLGSLGFGSIASFAALFYASRGWSDPALMLSVFGGCFMLCRAVFARRIGSMGALRVGRLCFAAEAAGLLLVGTAGGTAQVLAGAALAGGGFALVFPALGMAAVGRVDVSNRGAAIGAFALFADLALGISGPAGGAIAARAGYGAVFVAASVAAVGALGLVLLLGRRRPAGESA